MESLKTHWRLVAMTLVLIGFTIVLCVDYSAVFMGLPLAVLSLAVIGLKEYRSQRLGYLLGSILMIPISILVWFLILALLNILLYILPLGIPSNVFIPRISGQGLYVIFFAIWFLYALGLKDYFTDWAHRGSRGFLASMLVGVLAIVMINQSLRSFCSSVSKDIAFCHSLGFYYDPNVSWVTYDLSGIDVLLVPISLLVFVTLFTWIYRSAPSRINKNK